MKPGTLVKLFLLLPIGLPCAIADTQESTYDRLWSYAKLHQADQGFVRGFALSGRLQADASYFDADEGDFDDTNWRRFRFGFKAKFARDWMAQLEGDFDLNEAPDGSYSRLTDAYIGWQPDKARDLRILKHSAGFMLDGATSSKKLLTLQRSNLTNNLWFTSEYFTGLSMKGQLDSNWSYNAGVFSNDGNEELGSFDASYFSLTSVGYNWAKALDMKNAAIRLDYVYNDKHENNNTRDFSRVVSLSSKWENDNWGIWTDLGTGDGYGGQSDIAGLSVMPFFNHSELLQFVLRYTYIDSKDENGIRLGRYENKIVEGRGDEYNEYYAGVNLFFYGHKFKWQTGVQYAKLSDNADDGGEYHGWGITTGLRLSW